MIVQRIAILFSISFLIFGCSKSDSINEELPPSTINIDTAYWSFTINVDSTTYEASDIYKYWDIDNRCRITQNGGDIQIKISDKSDYSYISGETMNLNLIMNNSELDTGSVLVLGLKTFLAEILPAEKLGSYIISSSGSHTFIDPDNNFLLDSIFITSIGTPTIDTNTIGDAPDYIFGENVEGNISGNIYELETIWTDTIIGTEYHEYTTPRGYFSLEFSAIRLY